MGYDTNDSVSDHDFCNQRDLLVKVKYMDGMKPQGSGVK